MRSRLLVFWLVSALLAFGLVNVALAQEPSGDAAVVQAAAEAYLSSGKAPTISADAL